MFRLFRIFNSRHLRRQPLKTFLVLLGIALGVAVMVGIDLANQNALNSFRQSVEAVAGRATHEVVGGPAGVPDSIAAWLMRQPGITAAPVLEYVALCREAENQAVRLLAIEPFADYFFRDLAPQHSAPAISARKALLASPDQPADSLRQTRQMDQALGAFIKVMMLPGQAFIPESFAGRLPVAEGDSLHLLISGEWKRVVIAGIIPVRAGDRLSDEDLLVFDIATGQELLKRLGSADRVDLIGDDAAMEKLVPLLPQPLKLSRPERRSERIDYMLRSFRLNLTALSLLAVFVGMFLIYNTMMFSVLQRRRQIGILRCLGVTRRQVVSNLFFEATLLGLCGSVIGLGLGYFLSHYATQAVGATIRELYVYIKIAGVQIEAGIMLKGFLLGMIATWVAAILPALEAAGIAPAVAVRRSSLEIRAGRFVPPLAIVGSLFLIAAVVLALVPGGVFYGFAAALALALAAVLLTPLFTLGITRLLSAPIHKQTGTAGLLATRGIRGALSRTAVAIAALMISLSMVLGMQIMINSFRASIENWVNSVLHAEVYVSPLGATTAKWQAVLPDGFLKMIREFPEVDAVDTYSASEFEYKGRLIYLVSFPAEVLIDRTDFIFNFGYL